MMSEKNVQRFIKELEQIHGPELNAPPSIEPLVFYRQVEAKSKLSVLYAVMEQPLPNYPCTRIRK